MEPDDVWADPLQLRSVHGAMGRGFDAGAATTTTEGRRPVALRRRLLPTGLRHCSGASRRRSIAGSQDP